MTQTRTAAEIFRKTASAGLKELYILSSHLISSDLISTEQSVL